MGVQLQSEKETRARPLSLLSLHTFDHAQMCKVSPVTPVYLPMILRGMWHFPKIHRAVWGRNAEELSGQGVGDKVV